MPEYTFEFEFEVTVMIATTVAAEDEESAETIATQNAAALLNEAYNDAAVLHGSIDGIEPASTINEGLVKFSVCEVLV